MSNAIGFSCRRTRRLILSAFLWPAVALACGACAARKAGDGTGGAEAQPAAVETLGQEEAYEGYGTNKGGEGGKEIVVTDFAQLAKAAGQSNVYIKVRGELVSSAKGMRSRGSNITIDGGGEATIWGTPGQHYQRMLEFYGQNIVIKNIRARNAGDNFSFKHPANKIVLSHVTTSGSSDDGMSISYGTRNVTVQYCAFFGCTRSCFIKYKNPANISFHHNFIRCQWIRGPLVSGAKNVDVRNIVNEDWWNWGTRFEAGSTGNVINCTYVLTGITPAKPDTTVYTSKSPGKHCFRGNVARGKAQQPAEVGEELPAPKVTTHSAAEAERIVRARAGCLPRDRIDLAYINAKKWKIGGKYAGGFIIEPGPGAKKEEPAPSAAPPAPSAAPPAAPPVPSAPPAVRR